MSTIARSWQRFHLFLDAPRPLNRLIRQGYKLAWGVAMVGIVALFYFNASRFTAHRSTDLSLLFDRLIPFVPWTWWMYFPGYLACLIISIYAMEDMRHYYRGLWAIFVAQTICTFVFLILPSTYPRPIEAGGGITGDAIRWFWQIDPPNNTFPSKHVSISLVTASAVLTDLKSRRIFKMIVVMLALGVVVTVHTTKQHYLVDTLAGFVVASFSWWLVFRWWVRWRSPRPVTELPGAAAADRS